MEVKKLGRISGNESIIGRQLRIYDDPRQLDRYTVLMMDSPARQGHLIHCGKLWSINNG